MAKAMPEISGVLVMDKPAGRTSHDVVAIVRRLIGIRQVGHFGTLDPFATGVLPLSIGKATRFSQFYLKSRKAYMGTIRFGFATDTYDATGQPVPQGGTDNAPSTVELDEKLLESVMREFTGRILQTPPPFSAKRVGGTRAYKLARRHQPVELKPVEVEIYALELLGIEGERARFAVECSGGTYVRSLAHDLGRRIGCPAHLEGLRRTAVAEFTEEKAVTIEKLQSLGEGGAWREVLIPLEALLPGCTELVVGGRDEDNVRHGHQFELAPALRASRGGHPGKAPDVTLLKILNPERRLIAVARHVAGAVYHPDLVLV